MSLEDVRGVKLDSETRCVHYGTERDVVALRFGCCGQYYACYRCHEELTDHDPKPWPTDRREEPAVYCGVCAVTMPPSAYMSADECPFCGAEFNPGCADHYDRYFEWINRPGDG